MTQKLRNSEAMPRRELLRHFSVAELLEALQDAIEGWNFPLPRSSWQPINTCTTVTGQFPPGTPLPENVAATDGVNSGGSSPPNSPATSFVDLAPTDGEGNVKF